MKLDLTKPADTLIVFPTLGQNFGLAMRALTAMREHARVPAVFGFVVDQATPAQLKAFAQFNPDWILPSGERRGLVAAYQFGLEAFLAAKTFPEERQRFRYVHLMEDGITVTPGWDVVLRRVLEAHPEFGWVACGQTENKLAPFTSMCSLMTYEFVKATGGFDMQFNPRTYDDADLYLRGVALGFTPYAVPFKIHHTFGCTSRTFDMQKEYEHLARQQAKFRAKHGVDDFDWSKVEVHECERCMS